MEEYNFFLTRKKQQWIQNKQNKLGFGLIRVGPNSQVDLVIDLDPNPNYQQRPVSKHSLELGSGHRTS